MWTRKKPESQRPQFSVPQLDFTHPEDDIDVGNYDSEDLDQDPELLKQLQALTVESELGGLKRSDADPSRMDTNSISSPRGITGQHIHAPEMAPTTCGTEAGADESVQSSGKPLSEKSVVPRIPRASKVERLKTRALEASREGNKQLAREYMRLLLSVENGDDSVPEHPQKVPSLVGSSPIKILTASVAGESRLKMLRSEALAALESQISNARDAAAYYLTVSDNAKALKFHKCRNGFVEQLGFLESLQQRVVLCRKDIVEFEYEKIQKDVGEGVLQVKFGAVVVDDSYGAVRVEVDIGDKWQFTTDDMAVDEAGLADLSVACLKEFNVDLRSKVLQRTFEVKRLRVTLFARANSVGVIGWATSIFSGSQGWERLGRATVKLEPLVKSRGEVGGRLEIRRGAHVDIWIRMRRPIRGRQIVSVKEEWFTLLEPVAASGLEGSRSEPTQLPLACVSGKWTTGPRHVDEASGLTEMGSPSEVRRDAAQVSARPKQSTHGTPPKMDAGEPETAPPKTPDATATQGEPPPPMSSRGVLDFAPCPATAATVGDLTEWLYDVNNVISNETLELLVKESKDPEVRQSLEVKMQMLVAAVTIGQVTPEAYVNALRSAVAETKRCAGALARAGDRVNAKECLRRVKLMGKEISELSG